MLIKHAWTYFKGSAVTYATLIVNTIIAYPLVFIAVLPFAPIYIQLPAALIFALVASSPVWASNLWKQPKLTEKLKEKENDGSSSNPEQPRQI